MVFYFSIDKFNLSFLLAIVCKMANNKNFLAITLPPNTPSYNTRFLMKVNLFRLLFFSFCVLKFGVPRIELGLPKFFYENFHGSIWVLPVKHIIGVLGIEPRLHAPKACVLPLYYTPIICLTPKQAYYQYTTPRLYI